MLPYRRGSNSSDDDFFDVADETCVAVVKRQLRRPKTWVFIVLFSLIILIHYRYSSSSSSSSSASSYIDYDRVKWSNFAYTQYASSTAYLCNAVMIFDVLKQSGSQADRILFYPEGWGIGSAESKDRDDQLLAMARDKYDVLLVAVDDDLIKGGLGSSQSWNTSIAKFMAFGQTQYNRIIHIDSDSVISGNLDELFFLPPAQVAMPRAYYSLPNSRELASYLIVIEPSRKEFSALMGAAKEAAADESASNDPNSKIYDMDLLNARYGDSAMVLPHRRYGLVSGEFRAADHKNFLGSDDEDWDADKAISEAKFVHFSDWPLPKPWVMWPRQLLVEMIPRCHKPGTAEESGCRNREIWKGLYEDFRKRRKVRLLPLLLAVHYSSLLTIFVEHLQAPQLSSSPRR